MLSNFIQLRNFRRLKVSFSFKPMKFSLLFFAHFFQCFCPFFASALSGRAPFSKCDDQRYFFLFHAKLLLENVAVVVAVLFVDVAVVAVGTVS